LCRDISRPAIAEKRLSLTPNGNVRYQLKTPYRDGTTHVIFEPLDFMARLAALVPKPRVNLTRFHGDFCAKQQTSRLGEVRRIEGPLRSHWSHVRVCLFFVRIVLILLKNSGVRISVKTNLHESFVNSRFREQTSSNSTLAYGIWLPKASGDEATEFFNSSTNRNGHSPAGRSRTRAA
jgi:hypothetical protein